MKCYVTLATETFYKEVSQNSKAAISKTIKCVQ